MAYHHSAVADHARGHLWHHARSDDGSSQGQSHPGGLCAQRSRSESGAGGEGRDIPKPRDGSEYLRKRQRSRTINQKPRNPEGRRAAAGMRVGIIGTGAISHKHAQVYDKIGYELVVCTDINAESGRDFSRRHGCQFVATYEEVCRHPRVDYVDVCTFPDFRLQPLEICAQEKKHVQVQKPIATSLETARKMIETACSA